MLKSLFLPLFALATLLSAFVACNNDDTYADLREKENKQIDSFLKRGRTLRNPDNTADLFSVAPNIKVISETQFYAQDSTTNVAQNEYVLLAGSGVYLQILRKGTGEKIKQGETSQVICRFTEFDIAADTLTLSNMDWRYEQIRHLHRLVPKRPDGPHLRCHCPLGLVATASFPAPWTPKHFAGGDCQSAPHHPQHRGAA